MKIWIALIYQIVRRAMKSDAAWSYIESLIDEAGRNSALTGSEKRGWVLEQIDDLPAHYRTTFSLLANWMVNLAIETIVARRKVDRAA